MLTFQQLILKLQSYWDEQGCALLQPYDMEVGAGTSHTATFLRALGPEPWRAAYVQPSRRPKDGRYGENPNRLQHYYQFQVVLKPSPPDILDLYLGSLEALGFDLTKNDVRFVEDDWENPDARRVGPGLGSVDERHGDHAVHLLPAGGRPRLQADHRRDHLRPRAPRDVPAGHGERVRPRVDASGRERPKRTLTYGDVYHQNEVEQSTYNFEQSNAPKLFEHVRGLRGEAKRLLEAQLALPAYEKMLKAAHTFNLLDARGAISVTERAAYIGRIRKLSQPVAQSYYESRERAGLPDAAAEQRRPRMSAATLLVELLRRGAAAEGAGEAGRGVRDRRCARASRSAGFLGERRDVTAFATPRRLARVDHGRRARRSPKPSRAVKLMPVTVGLDAKGKPTQALEKKLEAQGGFAGDSMPAERIERRIDGKAGVLFTSSRRRRRCRSRTALQEALDEAIAKLPIPKVMSYQLADSETTRQVRAARRTGWSRCTAPTSCR